MMFYKEGKGFKAVYDEDSNLYTAGIFDPVSGSCTLFEINKETFESLDDENDLSTNLISEGRRLYMYHNDQYGSPYTIVFDEDYKSICPWASVPEPEEETSWPQEMTDAVIEAFEKINNNDKNS